MPGGSIKNQVHQGFQAAFPGSNPLLIIAPGRINLIGEHTDYNHGFVLPGAIDKCIVFGIEIQQAQVIDIHSLTGEHISISLEHDPISPKESWSRYFRAIVDEIRDQSLPIRGINCFFGGDIPIGSGLSSSAALCCGFLAGLNKLLDWDLSDLELAKIAQAAEHRIGAMVGLMDQFAVLFGKKDHVILLDCLDYNYKYFPLDLKKYSLVLINSNVKHEIAGSAYNDRRASCEEVLTRLREKNPEIETLRDASMEQVESSGSNKEDIRRVKFVFQENQRVQETTRALSKGNLPEVGQLLYASHQGLSKEYQVSCPELDWLVELTRRETGVLGARMMGGGFGGCSINLIKSSESDTIVSRILERYNKEMDITPESYPVWVEQGIHFIEP